MINCKHYTNFGCCNSEKIKATFFGFGEKRCVEYWHQEDCIHKIKHERPSPPPNPPRIKPDILIEVKLI